MKVTISDYIALGSVVVAILSLLVNLIPIWRDKAKLDFSLYIGQIMAFPMGKAVSQGNFYFFKIVNIGRRPVTIVNIGGISIVPWYQWVVYCLTRKLWVPKNFVISSPEIEACLKDYQSNYRTLSEGESTQAHLKITEASLIREDYFQAMRFWVSDSVGRKYYLPRKAHKKLKLDIKNLKQRATQ